MHDSFPQGLKGEAARIEKDAGASLRAGAERQGAMARSLRRAWRWLEGREEITLRLFSIGVKVLEKILMPDSDAISSKKTILRVEKVFN